MLHRVLAELLGLLDEEAQDEEDRGKDGTDTETGTPDGAQMVVLASRRDNVGNESTDNETLFSG